MQYQIEFLMLGLIVILGIFAMCFIATGIKILKEWERAAILRLGKYLGVRGPGIIWITPILDKVAAVVSLRNQETRVDTGEYVSSDGSTRRLTGYISWRVIDVEKAVLSVENYEHSLFNLVSHSVQKIAESFPGDTVMMDEESLYSEIRQTIEPTLSNWGIEINEINLKFVSEWDR